MPISFLISLKKTFLPATKHIRESDGACAAGICLTCLSIGSEIVKHCSFGRYAFLLWNVFFLKTTLLSDVESTMLSSFLTCCSKCDTWTCSILPRGRRRSLKLSSLSRQIESSTVFSPAMVWAHLHFSSCLLSQI